LKAVIHVAPKQTVLDPQGRAITRALQSHGHSGIVDVRQGKYFEVELRPGPGNEDVLRELEQIARDVLSNPVIEDYEVTLLNDQ